MMTGDVVYVHKVKISNSGRTSILPPCSAILTSSTRWGEHVKFQDGKLKGKERYADEYCISETVEECIERYNSDLDWALSVEKERYERIKETILKSRVL